MKILFLINDLDQAGGTERVCSLLATALSENARHQVGIISLCAGLKPFFYLPKNVAVFSLFRKKQRFRYIAPIVIWRLRRVLESYRPDVLINVNIDSVLCWYSLPALWQMEARNITWEHLNLNPGLSSRRMARALAARWADAVVTLTERDRVDWHRRFRPHAPVVVIPNPSPYPPRADTRPDDARVVLAAGSFTHRKGFDLLLRAWEAVEPPIRRDWHLRLVGSGDEADALRNLATKLRITDSVEFAGQKKEMEEEYRRAGFFVLPSRAECLPMVLLEAMSFGVPVVAFNCETGPAEIVVDGKTGLLAPAEDVQALATAIGRMIVDAGFRSECARQSLRRSHDYSLENVLRSWGDLFGDLSLA